MEYIQIGNRKYPREQCAYVGDRWMLRKEITRLSKRFYTEGATNDEYLGRKPFEQPKQQRVQK